MLSHWRSTIFRNLSPLLDHCVSPTILKKKASFVGDPCRYLTVLSDALLPLLIGLHAVVLIQLH